MRRDLSNNKKPLSLYVEKLIVTDPSVYADHQRFANTTNQDLVFLHMKIYFAHYIAIINQKFVKTFKNDPDLKIYVQLKNLLFLTVSLLHKIMIKLNDLNFFFF